ncbi:MAG: peptidoglycan-binding protein [Hyphomicrobiales bacterium]
MMKSAQQGYPLAQFWLASMYEHGNGTEKDVQRSLYWYEQAARGGHVSAMFNLAVMKASGVEGKKDYGQTALWMRQAADHGLKTAQYNMGLLHWPAQGLRKMLVKRRAGCTSLQAAVSRRRRKNWPSLKSRCLPMNSTGLKNLQHSGKQFQQTKTPMYFPPKPQKNAAKSTQEPSPLVELSKANIQEIQAYLNALGYGAGTPDGNVGPKTKEAVRQFQAANGLVPSGEINLEFLKKLTKQPG